MGTFRRRWPGLSYGRGEDWHYVGEAGEPAFATGWSNSTGNPKLAFRIRESGVVDVAGVVDASSAGATVFTFPEGYRPDNTAYGVSAFFKGTGNAYPLSVSTAGVLSFRMWPSSTPPPLSLTSSGVPIYGSFFLVMPVNA